MRTNRGERQLDIFFQRRALKSRAAGPRVGAYLGSLRTFCGTPPYMSPQMISDQPSALRTISMTLCPLARLFWTGYPQTVKRGRVLKSLGHPPFCLGQLIRKKVSKIREIRSVFVGQCRWGSRGAWSIERINTIRYCGFSCDVWALGVLLYVLLVS